jgi:predicted ribosome quality control (RQC) complex YloA/Tae2 family protein
VQEETIQCVIAELGDLLPGRFLGKVFQLSALSVALDFGIRERGYLFISIEPAAPRLYLIKRTGRQLEKQSIPLGPFGQAMRTKLGGARLESLTKDNNERIVRLSFAAADTFGQSQAQVLVVQLTGRSTNLFLLDATGTIEHAWRNLAGDGQKPGELYLPPRSTNARNSQPVSQADSIEVKGSETFSEAADKYYSELARQSEFDQRAAQLRANLRKENNRLKKLEKNLRNDLAAHGDPAAHKRIGDLLLANIANAKRAGASVFLTDYYAEGTPTVEISVDENASLQEAAASFFSQYSKAKRAVEEIGERLTQVENELTALETKRGKLEKAIVDGDVEKLSEFAHQKDKPSPPAKRKSKASPQIPGVRRYRSSDGYEVLVGRTARDNDQLTFRLARPNDLWLHASDYPGSHVVVRNTGKGDIPHRTVLEAAQLAAKFSQAGKDGKVNIHYTRRKFLAKPKGAAPGLVRMSSFKTVLVEPGENIERVK